MASTLAMLARATLLRCPRCGSGGLFGSRFSMVAHCPRCGLRLEREDGALLGSMALSIGATSLGFIFLFTVAVVVTWPGVPWVAVTVGGVGFCAIFPIVFYPFSKTLWAAIDLILHGSESAGSFRAGRRVVVTHDVSALAVSALGASRPVVVPAGTVLVLARDRHEDVPRVTCMPEDAPSMGLAPDEYLVVSASDLAA